MRKGHVVKLDVEIVGAERQGLANFVGHLVAHRQQLHSVVLGLLWQTLHKIVHKCLHVNIPPLQTPLRIKNIQGHELYPKGEEHCRLSHTISSTGVQATV